MSEPAAGGSMRITLKVWRQPGPDAPGAMETYHLHDVSPDMSFLEMFDVLNQQLLETGAEPVAFDSDCREGICGTCCMMIDGRAHGPERGTATCQLHMRHYRDGDTIHVEPWRADAFPIVKDLVVDRSAFDRIVAAGGFVSTHTGAAPDANAIPVPRDAAESAMDAAACIGCGACVAACPNGSAMLFVGSKVSQLALLPQGRPERERRVLDMVAAMDGEGFGNCSNHYECEAACPKEISVETMARMNREYLRALFASRRGA
jgi:succinate dehydrogenase / fumarate reductase iron-sulfur subunit